MKGLPDGSRFTAWALVTQLGLTMVAVHRLRNPARGSGSIGWLGRARCLRCCSRCSESPPRAWPDIGQWSAAFAQLDRERAEHATKRSANRRDKSTRTMSPTSR